MKISTGNDSLDRYILRLKNLFMILYGEPGSGKSNIALKIAKESILRRYADVYYISTEGDLIIERMKQINMPEYGLYFTNITTISQLLKAVLKLYNIDPDLVIVDSINNLYRAEIMYSERVNQIFIAILAFLKQLSEIGVPIIASAQVRDIYDSIEPSAFRLIKFYTDIFGKVSRILYTCRVLEIFNEKYIFRITEGDVTWMSSTDQC